MGMTYESEIAQFYARLRLSRGRVFTKVNGVEIQFDEAWLLTLLRVSNGGVVEYDENLVLNYILLRDIVKKFSGGHSLGKCTSLNQTQLFQIHKMLYNLVRRSVVPRIEWRNQCTKMDLTYMELLESGIQIDLPKLITHMAHIANDGTRSLAYGSIITVILQAFEVPLDEELGEKIPGKEIMGDIALTNHGLHVIDGVIIKIEQTSKPSQEEEEESHEEEKENPPITRLKVSSPGKGNEKVGDGMEERKLHLEKMLSGFMETVQAKLTSISSELTSKVDSLGSTLNDKLSSLSTEVAHLKQAIKPVEEPFFSTIPTDLVEKVAKESSITVAPAETGFDVNVTDPATEWLLFGFLFHLSFTPSFMLCSTPFFIIYFV